MYSESINDTLKPCWCPDRYTTLRQACNAAASTVLLVFCMKIVSESDCQCDKSEHIQNCCVQVSSQGGSNSCGDTKTRPNSCSVSRVSGSRPIVILTNYVFIQTKHDINDHTASNSLCEPSVINLTDIDVVKSRLVNTKLLNWPFNVH